MINKFFKFNTEKDFLTKELDDFEKMISLGESIYRTAVKQLTSKELPGLKVRDDLYAADKSINKLERKVRKRVVTHLSFNPSEDLPTALIFMSVVKDAERIGDYGKNLFEISDILSSKFSAEYFDKWFKPLDVLILDIFDKTRRCFLEGDKEIARDIMQIERGLVKMCDHGVKSLAGSSVDTNTAVCGTLVYRYFKRIAAHLGNIATSVIVPVSDLDYYDENRVE